ncbi:MAG TPA: LL-diaminopimelate aminotransferase [Candidatus Pacearchaeota archaeon]|nr:LL-diaminopimelate aminotransferase [archaeon BMS3Abin17]HDK42130.1 LL-diaminopimelate aminotransferase [Candidatus Pacearchaeota archaeon]HDZ60887.1 LL-diaminopimelate aminotransferase [Candidatus Pacearchaeota archaeon]
MVKLNPNYEKLQKNYLFRDIGNKAKEFRASTGIEPMKLGIGDTTEPLTPTVVEGLRKGVDNLADRDTYSGYGDEHGALALKKAIVKKYKERGIDLDPSEVFINDGAKPDTANIQYHFHPEETTIAVQDPSYTVYIESNVIAGKTGEFNKKTGLYEGVVYMPCKEENNFLPEVPKQKAGLIYLCNPNNPTGSNHDRKLAKAFVDKAIEDKSVIISDGAYEEYILDSGLVRSIYEAEEAKKCSIEMKSFSKDNGFTGVRLGYTIIPHELVVEGTSPGEVHDRWSDRQSRFFNEASIISQLGGLAALTNNGVEQSKILVNYYMENAKIIKKGLESMGLTVYGGINAPYLWMKTPNNMGSWQFFDKMLNETHVIGAPGVGFGPSGEGFFRLSAFGLRGDVEKAVESITNNLRL